LPHGANSLRVAATYASPAGPRHGAIGHLFSTCIVFASMRSISLRSSRTT